MFRIKQTTSNASKVAKSIDKLVDAVLPRQTPRLSYAHSSAPISKQTAYTAAAKRRRRRRGRLSIEGPNIRTSWF